MASTLAPDEEAVLARLMPELLRLSPAAQLELIRRLVESILLDMNTNHAQNTAASPATTA